MSSLLEQIQLLLARIPVGKVVTYGQIANLLHTSPRIVGNVLHKNKEPDKYPCHRVVKSDGSLAKGYAFGGRKTQENLLQAEGVNFSKKRVLLKDSQYTL